MSLPAPCFLFGELLLPQGEEEGHTVPWSSLGMLPAAAREAEVAKPDPQRVSAPVWCPARCQSPVTPSQLPARASFTCLCRRASLAERGVQPEVSSTLPSLQCVGWGAEAPWLLAVFCSSWFGPDGASGGDGLCIPSDEVLQPRRPYRPQAGGNQGVRPQPCLCPPQECQHCCLSV